MAQSSSKKTSQGNQEIRKALESGGRVLPNSFEAEQAVLGCALIDSEVCLSIVGKLEEEDFYNETHRNIFKAIKDLQNSPVIADFVTV